MPTEKVRKDGIQFRITRKSLFDGGYHFSVGHEHAEEGRRHARNLEKVLDLGIIPPEIESWLEMRSNKMGSQMTIAVAIREYTGVVRITDEDMRQLNTITLEFGREAIADFSYKRSERWITAMKREKNLAPGTIRKYVGALSRCLNWCVQHELMPANPLLHLPKNYSAYTEEDEQYVEKKRDRSIWARLDAGTEDNIRKVLAGGYVPENKQRALELRHREAQTLMLDLALETAMRLGEMLSLEVGQINFQEKTIFLENTKNGDSRQVPMSSVIERLLREYIDQQGLRPQDRLLPFLPSLDGMTRKEAANEKKRASSKQSRIWKRIFEHAGDNNFTTHLLRHEAISRFYERTEMRKEEVMDAVGHKSDKAHARYRNIRGSYLANKMW